MLVHALEAMGFGGGSGGGDTGPVTSDILRAETVRDLGYRLIALCMLFTVCKRGKRGGVQCNTRAVVPFMWIDSHKWIQCDTCPVPYSGVPALCHLGRKVIRNEIKTLAGDNEGAGWCFIEALSGMQKGTSDDQEFFPGPGAPR
jgi:hypothetical protein